MVESRGKLLSRSYVYIYIIYTPNLGLRITIPGLEREQGRFRGSTKGAKGRSGGARGSTGEHRRSTRGSNGAQPKGA